MMWAKWCSIHNDAYTAYTDADNPTAKGRRNDYIAFRVPQINAFANTLIVCIAAQFLQELLVTVQLFLAFFNKKKEEKRFVWMK